jgi:hypothetical protein
VDLIEQRSKPARREASRRNPACDIPLTKSPKYEVPCVLEAGMCPNAESLCKYPKQHVSQTEAEKEWLNCRRVKPYKIWFQTTRLSWESVEIMY